MCVESGQVDGAMRREGEGRIKMLIENMNKEEGEGEGKREEGTKDQETAEKQAAGSGSETAVESKQGKYWLFENKLEWLSTAEAATYLRKVSPKGIPSVNAIHKLVSQGKVRRRKFSGRLYFKRKELDYLIETSEA